MFDKDVPKCCAYCQHGQPFDQGTVLCEKQGPVTPQHRCFRFRYDPFKREPPPAPRMKKPRKELNFDLD